MSKFQSPSGMPDRLPEDMRWLSFLEQAASRIADAYAFNRIETPMLEEEDLFRRSVGQTTDIVEKEMYALRTRGGDRLALRPDGTAGIVRAYLQHGMRTWTQPVRLWYFGPMFRHERPQAGRLRQFFQIGFEIIGEDDVAADAETVLVTTSYFREIGLKQFMVQVGSIGCSLCRPVYRKTLVASLRSRKGELCANCRRRLKANPLRTLDCKEERCQRALQDVPEIFDHLCEPCRAHLRSFLEHLEEMKIAYLLNARLVRGLDYYTRTVFEIYPGNGSPEELPAQAAIASGGRYDALFRAMGAKPIGATGGAIGAERIIEALRASGFVLPEPLPPQVFLAQLGDQAKRKAPVLFEELRRARFRVRASFGRDSIKSQLRIADKFGAPIVLILGQKEVADSTVILRLMATGAQESVKRENLVQTLRDRLKVVSETKKSRRRFGELL